MRALLSMAGFGLSSLQAGATDVDISVELPRINVAEYHKPYVAVWLSTPDHKVVANLAVWYQQYDGEEGEGKSWLKDVRQWWRRSGRRLELPIDGVSSPTRGPGVHHVAITDKNNPFKALAAGDYVLNIEAAREVGGRELLKIPFQWEEGLKQEFSVEGSSEIGSVTLKFE